jgi:hypothetical protein
LIILPGHGKWLDILEEMKEGKYLEAIEEIKDISSEEDGLKKAVIYAKDFFDLDSLLDSKKLVHTITKGEEI